MKEQVPVEKLAKGMFVSELDRPWLESPFLIQGFVIDTEEQIGQLQRCCKHVFVERGASKGDQFRPEVVEKRVPQRNATPARPQPNSADAALSKPKEGLLGFMGRILKAAFSSAPREPAAEVEAVAPRRPTVAKEPSVIIYQDSAVKRPQAPKRRAAPARREAGISSEERAYLERATDPDASVRIYSEKELAARDGILGRLKRLFGGGDARNPPAAQAVVRAPDALVYEDQTLIEEELPLAKDAHGKADDIVKEVIADLNKSKTLDLEKVGDAVGWMVQSVVRNPDGLIWLARLKSVDAYTYDHGLNSAIYLIAFGRHLGLPEDQLQVIGTVGLMQDIGKVKVPPGLLEKRAKLTLPERSIIQSHVSHSVAILSASKDASQTLIDVVREHHERYDGSGYPKGLAGEQLSMLGGMAGLVDTYTAMISVRSYAQPMSVQRALHELYTMRDRAFKASLVEEFIQCVGVFPVGSLVELNTTEVAVVVSQNRSRRLKPRVMLVMDANRQPFAVPAMLDLVTDPPTSTGEIYRIVRGLQAGLYDVDPRQTLDAVMGAE